MSSIELFENYFQTKPAVTSFAHGRVNLIGEHTDYNNGYVLPALISQSIEVSLRSRNDDQINGISSEFGDLKSTINSSKDGTWLDFVRGALFFIQKISPDIQGVDVAVHSTIPSSSGLSSSAALEIALLRSLTQLHGLSLKLHKTLLWQSHLYQNEIMHIRAAEYFLVQDYILQLQVT